MDISSPSSIQSIIRQRHDEEFLGRETHLEAFQRNLDLPITDSSKKFIYAISGQGGVGKTWLLHRYLKLLEQAGEAVALVDESVRDIPTAMGKLSRHLESAGFAMKSFDERYKTFREKRQELEADPEAPQAFPSIIGRAIAKGGIRLARRIPVGGVAFDLVEEEAVASALGDVATYVARRLTNKDEVRLILEPVEVLTPLFLKELTKIAERTSVALLFDTFEQTGMFLEGWLRDLFEGRYGLIPSTVLTIIAGQSDLDRNAWTNYESIIARVQLEPFSEPEAEQFLSRRGITDPAIAEVILRLSGRLPLLMATLASEGPKDKAQLSDPSDTAVSRFLKWVDTPDRRRFAINCALPRRINQDVLSAIIGQAHSEMMYSWLKSTPFVVNDSTGRRFHDVVRELMLRQKLHEAPREWADIHSKLAQYYRDLQIQAHGEGEDAHDRNWQSLELERLYHRLCESPTVHFSDALNGFVSAFTESLHFAEQWGETVLSAGRHVESQLLQDWGQSFTSTLRKLKAKEYKPFITLLSTLLKHNKISLHIHPTILRERSLLYIQFDKERLAYEDLTEAIRLAPEQGINWFLRGVLNDRLNNLEDALNDFDKFSELTPNDPGVAFNRARVLQRLGRSAEALQSFESASSEKRYEHLATTALGTLLGEMGKHNDAVTAFTKAIQQHPDCNFSWVGIIDNLQRIHRDEEVPKLLRRLPIQGEPAMILESRGYALLSRKLFKEALDDFDDALRTETKTAQLFAGRGFAFMSLRRYPQALSDFEQALRLDPQNPLYSANMGEILSALYRDDEALAYFNKVLQFDNEVLPLKARAQVLWRLGRTTEALEDLDAAIKKSPGDSQAYFHRGRININLHRYEQAKADLDEAISLNSTTADYYSARGESYGGLGNSEKALADFETAFKIDSNQARAYLGRGVVKRQQREYNDSLSDLRKALSIDPQLLHEGNKEIGKTLHAMGLHRKAINAFEKSLFSSPECSECWSSLASTLAEIHPLREIPRLLRSVVLPPPKKNEVSAYRALALKKLELYEDALVDFGKTLARNGDQSWVLVHRGDTYFALNRDELALKDYQRALNLDPSLSKKIYFKIGVVLTRVRRFKEAIHYFEQVSDASQSEFSLYYNAIAQFYTNGPVEAEVYITRATCALENFSDKKSDFYFYCLGGLAALQGEAEDALVFLKQAIDSDESIVDWINGDPAWDTVRADLRFLQLID